MKSKKHLGFVSAVLGTCLAVTSFTAVVALADDAENSTTTITYVGNDDTNKNTDKVFYQNPISEHFTVKKNDTESSFDYNKIKDDQVTLTNADGSALAEGVEYKYEKGTLMVNTAGTYMISAEFTDASVQAPVTSIIEVVDSATLTVDTQGEDFDAFVTALASETQTIASDVEEIKIPSSVWGLVNSNVYSAKDNGQILVKVYLASSGGSFSAVNSSFKAEMPKLTLSESGTYEFYFEVQDPDGNKIVKESDYVQKTDGWYKVETDDKGTPDDDTDDEEIETLVLPIFKFNYTKVEKLDVTVTGGGDKGVKGIVGQEYTSIKISSNGTYNDVKLLYSKTKDGTYDEATEDEATYGTLSTSSTRFTPLVKGYFKVVVQAKGGEGGFATESVTSEIISVQREIQKQKLVNVKFRNFLKNNWLSVVFLGIAFLCIVGIIVLAFYKPKDANEVKKAKKVDNVEDEEVVEDATEENVEENIEDASEEETVEEVVEENAEVVEEATEEVVNEEPVVEATEETVEAPVEEVVAPVETAEAVEEVKNDGENA